MEIVNVVNEEEDEPELECDENRPCEEGFTCIENVCTITTPLVNPFGLANQSNQTIFNETNFTLVNQTNFTTNITNVTSSYNRTNSSSGNVSNLTSAPPSNEPDISEPEYSDAYSDNNFAGGNNDVVGDVGIRNNKTSLITWVMIVFIIFVAGIAGIYLYMFKFKKYGKSDIIMWVEFCRDMLSKGNGIEEVKKKMYSQNLPEDFIKIILKRL